MRKERQISGEGFLHGKQTVAFPKMVLLGRGGGRREEGGGRREEGGGTHFQLSVLISLKFHPVGYCPLD
jgi:hypothetical protein